MENCYVRLKVSGDLACWTRPESKVERGSSECMTPSAARNILDAICWKPEMRWVVTRILVLKPVRFQAIRRHELQSKIAPRAGGKRRDASCWKPEMRWVVTRILVLKPVRFQAIRRNELQSKIAPGAVGKWMKDPGTYQIGRAHV